MQQRAVALGFQGLSVSSSAVGLTLPLGTQAASGTSCSLLGKVLTVGGTVTGAFAVGQTVTGTGIPVNTTIVSPGPPSSNTWNLSNSCTTETGETVTAYQPIRVDFALIRTQTNAVNWRDDGTAPTTSSGMAMLTADPPLQYASNLSAIQFIAQTGTAAVGVSYYQFSGPF